MSQTTLTKLIKQLDQEIKKVSLGGINYYGLIQAREMAKFLLIDEQENIEHTYDSGKSDKSDCSGHKFFFMNYISND